MNSDEKLDAIFQAIRESAPAADDGEYAFETRLMARVREERRSAWTTWAWRLSPIFAALVVAAAMWCWSFTGIEAEAGDVVHAVSSGGESALVAWLGEDER